MKENQKQSRNNIKQQEIKPKVTGIGGIFFSSENLQKSKKWYAENLGLETDQWGSLFEYRNAHKPEEINYLQWSPSQSGSEFFNLPKKSS